MNTRNFILSAWLGLLLVLVSITAAVMAQEGTESAIHVTGAWSRPADRSSAAYMRITNNGSSSNQLVRVETPIGRAEIHETQMDGEVMRMRELDAVELPAGGTVVLEPGGVHIMLMNLTAPLESGDTYTLTLHFAAGNPVDVVAFVRHQPIPQELPVDTLTEQALGAVETGTYVGQVVNPPIQVQDFSAPSSNPDLDRLSDTNSRWRVIFFGYMHCPDFCPLTLSDYRHVKAELGDDAGQVTFMFISVDSARDTPEAMRRYLANFDPEFVGFAPDDTTLARIQPDYGFYFERRMDSGTQAIYTIDHSTRSYLLDRDGVLRASFAYDTDPHRIADALLWYLEHE